MATPIRMPDIGTTVDVIRLVRWLKQVGQPVKRGEALCEVESDKAVSALESHAEGVLLRQEVDTETDIKQGTIIAWVGAPGESLPGGAGLEASVARLEPRPTGGEAAGAGGAGLKPRPRPPELRQSVAAPEATGARAAGDGGPCPEPREPVAAAEARVYTKDFLLGLYRRMLLIRRFEERVKFLFLEGVMPGTIHQCQGQEACAVGVCAALGPQDVITSTHRPHGHCLAKGLSVEAAMGELFGKVTGCCRGKGGSMHLGDLSRGIVPAVAIVGGGVPIATGLALAFKMNREPRVAVAFSGDGAVNEGAFHEGVNMGAIWDLPVVYVVENNLYGASTPVQAVIKTQRIADRAPAYGIRSATVDGNDVLAVYEAARSAVERARQGRGPTLLELMTYRITGHSRRDPCHYQPEAERREALEREPIKRFAGALLAQGVADAAALDQIGAGIDQELEAAVKAAMAAPAPRPEDALADVFVEEI